MKSIALSVCILLATAAAHGHKHQHDEDKSKAISPLYDTYVQKLKDAFGSLLALRPTGRPEFHSIMKVIEEKYKEAKKNMESARPHGKHGHHDHDYKKAYDQLKKQKEEAKHQVEQWKKQVEDELKKQEEQRLLALLSASPFGSALAAFKQDFDNEFAGRPTGRPDAKKFLHALEKKYKDAKKNLHNLRPTGRPSKNDHDLYHHAKEVLKSHYEDAWEKVEAWKKKVDHDHHKKPEHHKKPDHQKATQDSAIDYNTHVQKFKSLFDSILVQRPTGRPDLGSFMKLIEEKYKEAKKSMEPKGHGHHHHHNDEFKKAYEQLKKHKEEAKNKVEQWKEELKKEEEQKMLAKLAASPFGSALAAFKQTFDNEFAARPTGRPDVKGFMKALEKKYKDAKKNLYGLRPTGRPSKDDHDLFHNAKELLKDHYEDAWEKVEAWKKQVDHDKHKHHGHHKKPKHH